MHTPSARFALVSLLVATLLAACGAAPAAPPTPTTPPPPTSPSTTANASSTPDSVAPATTPMTEPQQVSRQIAIEVTYRLTREPLIQVIPSEAGDSRIGVRRVFPVEAGTDGLDFVSNAIALGELVDEEAPLRFWVARTDEDAAPVLISVGADEPFSSLQVDAEAQNAPLFPPDLLGTVVRIEQQDQLLRPLGGPDTTVEELTVWLEDAGGLRFPLLITGIGHVETALDAKSIFPEVYLALLGSEEAGYRAILVGSPEFVGPPDTPDSERCANLVGDDYFTRFLRTIYQCP